MVDVEGVLETQAWHTVENKRTIGTKWRVTLSRYARLILLFISTIASPVTHSTINCSTHKGHWPVCLIRIS